MLARQPSCHRHSRLWLGVGVSKMDLSLISIQRDWACGLFKIDQSLIEVQCYISSGAKFESIE
jgi:hypothetical protein